jgi:Protein of unknown function (DUF3592)
VDTLKFKFGGVIGLIAFLGAGTMALKATLLFSRAQGWPSARGRILESRLFKKEDGKTHFLIRYDFEVKERTIESQTPRLAGDWFSDNQSQANFVARFPVDSDVSVFYDPHNPDVNCIDRSDWSGIRILWLFCFCGGALGFSLVFWLLAQ